MFFNLYNISSFFQHFINDVLRKYLNDFIMIYINDIFIYFNFSEKYKYYIRLILKKLYKTDLYFKFKKY